MKRYRFRLEPVLRVRRHAEEAARGALLAASAAVSAQERAAQERAAEYAAATAGGIAGSADRIRLEHARRSALAAAVLEQRRLLADARAGLESARQAWTAAAAAVSALERLDERQRGDHAAAALKEDDQLTDELVVSRHGRAER